MQYLMYILCKHTVLFVTLIVALDAYCKMLLVIVSTNSPGVNMSSRFYGKQSKHKVL